MTHKLKISKGTIKSFMNSCIDSYHYGHVECSWDPATRTVSGDHLDNPTTSFSILGARLGCHQIFRLLYL